MSLILALALAQAPAVVGTVPVPNAELDAAHACLKKGTESLLAESRPAPDEQARWDWAVAVAAGCEAQIEAAASAKGSVVVLGQYAHTNISKRDMLRAEANYFVDRLIREHYEAKA
ncbi:hypothetical protein [Erythrobacter colymbi]|uniref:hypothetical protein n=1 Tax=Erythrobacter colymbi TaxID=1161202 RepID=UPI000A3A801C|nr:hypothetical protein [Erythrobacter colymbi]